MVKENSREELINLIQTKLFSSSNESFKQKVLNFMSGEGRFSISDYQKLAKGLTSLENLQDSDLYWFAYALEKAGNEVEPRLYICKVSDYFTPSEIKNAPFFKRENIDLDSLYVLHNVTKLANNQYNCTITLEQLANMKRKLIVRATPELQRESKRLNLGSEILKVLNVDVNKAKNISSEIVNGQYYFDEIRFSLINDGNISFEYNEDKHLIYLPKNGDIIITDGNHRTVATEMAYSDHSEMIDIFRNNSFPISFTFLPPDDIKSMIFQKWLATPPSKKHKDAMERTFANRIVEWIQIDPNAEDIYKGSNIATTGYERAFIIQSELAEAIDRFYNVNDLKLKSQAEKIKNWLVEFFNYLSELMIDDFSNYFAIRKSKWSTESKTWIGYTFLSSVLENDPNWKCKLKSFLNSVDWNRSASPIKRATSDEKLVEKYFIEKWSAFTNV